MTSQQFLTTLLVLLAATSYGHQLGPEPQARIYSAVKVEDRQSCAGDLAGHLWRKRDSKKRNHWSHVDPGSISLAPVDVPEMEPLIFADKCQPANGQTLSDLPDLTLPILFHAAVWEKVQKHFSMV